MAIRTAIIGGTGLGHHIAQLPGKAMYISTPHGLVKGKVVEFSGQEIYCLSRHSSGHKVPPHQVKYLALASALSSLQVKACFASAAVGCLNPHWDVGDFVLCSDFIDLSGRRTTAFSDAVEHRDFTDPFDSGLCDAIRTSAIELEIKVEESGVYANLNGPRYETPQEIRSAGILGANLVGMTAGSEAIAMKELNVPYACVCVVTNAAAGLQPGQLDHLDVVTVMEEKGKLLLGLLLNSAERMSIICN